jgi:hypothetical protein
MLSEHHRAIPGPTRPQGDQLMAKTLADTVQEQTLEVIEHAQQTFLDACGAWVDAWSGVVPENLVPTLPAGLPKAEEAVEQSFVFAQSLLENQREFAKKVFAAAHPQPVKSTSKAA